MNEIKKTSKLVKQILIESEAARNSDTALYIKVCERLNPSVLWMPFLDVMVALDALNLPPFETVRRARQKVQEKCPELAATLKVLEFREEKENEFREYAREG